MTTRYSLRTECLPWFMEVVHGSNNARYTDKSQGKKEASLTPIDKFEEVAMGEEERPRPI